MGLPLRFVVCLGPIFSRALNIFSNALTLSQTIRRKGPLWDFPLKARNTFLRSVATMILFNPRGPRDVYIYFLFFFIFQFFKFDEHIQVQVQIQIQVRSQVSC